jgi:hypothetical protein
MEVSAAVEGDAMTDMSSYDEARRVLSEAEHNPAGERLIHLAGVRATLAVAEELRALREAVNRLAPAEVPSQVPAEDGAA